LQDDGQDLVADLDDLPGDGRAHDRRPRRPQARARLRLRGDGRPQARRVCADPHVPRPRRLGEGPLAMADRQGGKQGDPGTKQDQPSDQAGAEKAAVEAADAKAAQGQEQAAEAAEAKPKPKRAPRKKATPKAEDTAAEETGVDKDAAEVEKPKRAPRKKAEPAA